MRHFTLGFQYSKNTSEVITQKMLKASSSLQLETSGQELVLTEVLDVDNCKMTLKKAAQKSQS